MKDLMKDIFPFDENNGIKLQLCLYLRESNGLTIKQNAEINFDGSQITLSTTIEQNANCKTRIHYNNRFDKKNVSFKEAMVRGVKIHVGNQPIYFTHYITPIGKPTVCSMNFINLEYQISNKTPINYYRLSNDAQFLADYLNDFQLKDGKVVGLINITCSFFLYKSNNYILFHDGDRVYLKTNSDPMPFLAVTSFFSCCPIEIVMENKNGNICVFEPHYKACLKEKTNQLLGYLFCGNKCLNYFTDFIDLLASEEMPLDMGKIYLYIDYYVRAEYLDEISRLIIYTSILERISEVKKGDDTYEIINKYFKKLHISVDKVNCDVSKKVKDNENKSIDNFVQLRNFFVHHLGNKNAESYLRNSDLLFNLKMAITIVILKKLGIKEVQFDRQFHHLSIFDDFIPEGDNFQK